MTFLAILLGTILGIVLVILILFLYLVNKLNATIGKDNMKLLKDRLKEGFKDGGLSLDQEYFSTIKSITGMTDIYKPMIEKDFDDFHVSELFSLNNKNLTSIFNALESKDISNITDDSSFDLIRGNIYQEIQDMISTDTNVSYDDIKINRNTIKSYSNKNGSATIEVNTSLSYYFKTNKKGVKNFENIRKETRYTTKYILVYDAKKFNSNSVTYAVNCKNCGAPVPTKGDTTCRFCGSHVEGVDFNTINLKGWKLISYKEY
jgi:endogenous inhibitor of DNA gyrase (YacG/DUF329 family)